jgi:hypothetical protein
MVDAPPGWACSAKAKGKCHVMLDSLIAPDSPSLCGNLMQVSRLQCTLLWLLHPLAPLALTVLVEQDGHAALSNRR